MNLLSKLKGYFADDNGTWLKIYIPGVDLQEKILKKEIQHLEIRFDDGRHISNEQRKKIYATVKDICEYTGYLPEEQKEWLKYLHIARTGCDYFSLSNCSMDTAREYINTIIDYCLENGIQLQDSIINRTDDINHTLYKCIKTKTCCICGKKADIHHCEGSRIGMGGNRRRVDHKERYLIALCRIHHNKCHDDEFRFMKEHHVYGIKISDMEGIEVIEDEA